MLALVTWQTRRGISEMSQLVTPDRGFSDRCLGRCVTDYRETPNKCEFPLFYVIWMGGRVV